MSALAINLDERFDANLRPAWLRPAALACAIMVHALLLLAVWPKDNQPPAETNIEITVVPQQLATEPAGATSAGSLPQLSPSEAMPLDARSPIDPVVPSEEAKPAEVKSAEPVLPSEILPQPAQIGLAAPAPPVATEQVPPPAAPPLASQPVAPQTPPVVQADQGTTPVVPTLPAPLVTKPRDEKTQRLAAEQREQVLQHEKEAAKRQATEKERQAAEDVKRQAEARQRAAQRAAAARPASLPPAQSPVAGGGQARSPALPTGSPAGIAAFRGQVIGHLAGYKRYPESARARGAEGRPTVAFSLDPSGHVTSVSLSHSSGQPDIDAEVVAMVRRASPFPTPPPGANRSFSATIGFVLH